MTRRCAIPLFAAKIAQPADRAATHAIYRSLDRGHTWARADQGIPDSPRTNAFIATGNWLLAGTGAGIFRSIDSVPSWRRVAAQPAISFASLGTRIFAGTNGSGLLMSEDSGSTWKAILRFPSAKVRALLSDGGRLYAGTDADGVLVSDRLGDTWTPLNHGLPPHAQIFALSLLQGVLFAGLYGRGLYAWSDPAQGWIKTGDVSPLALARVNGTLIAGHNPGGVLWSDDLGTSWTRGTGAVPALAPVWEAGAGDGLAFIGAAAGIYFSSDQGRTWRQARTGLPEKSTGIAFLVTTPLILAAISQ